MCFFTGGKRKTKRDVSRLLKIALDVDMSEEKIGDVNKVFIEQEKSYTSLWKKAHLKKYNNTFFSPPTTFLLSKSNRKFKSVFKKRGKLMKYETNMKRQKRK